MNGDGQAPEAPPSELIHAVRVPHFFFDRIGKVLPSKTLTTIMRDIYEQADILADFTGKTTLISNTVIIPLKPGLTAEEKGAFMLVLFGIVLNAVAHAMSYSDLSTVCSLAAGTKTALFHGIKSMPDDEELDTVPVTISITG